MSQLQIQGQPSIIFAEECDRGILRQENLDSVLHARIAMGELLVVADGVGCYMGGTAASSRMVVEYFYAHLAALPHDYPAADAIREAAAQANANLLAAAGEPALNARMGSTVVVVLLQQEADEIRAWVGNIGDSRAYLLRAGHIYRLTTDHSAVQSLLDRNLIIPEDAQHHPDASALTRSLGHRPEVEIDIEQQSLAVGDTLLLCSDGLWRYVPELEIKRVSAGPTLDAAAHNLLELALAAGGHDNIGIEMARVIPPAIAPRRAGFPLAMKLIVAMFLLAIAGMCVLAYLTFFNN